MLNEVIKKYYQTFEVLESTVNTKTHLVAIVSFFEYCGEKSSAHFYENFIGDFLSHIIKIFKDSTLSFIDPYFLNASKHILQKAKEIEKEEIIIYEINYVIELINIRLLLVYFYLGEIENGRTVLFNILNSKVVTDSGVSLDDYGDYTSKHNGKKNSLVDPNLFKVNKVFDILRQINYEITRINSFSTDEVNILLVESDNSFCRIKDFGIVQGLTCSITNSLRQDRKNPFIENIIDIDNIDIADTRKEMISVADKILLLFKSKLNLNRKQINLKFRDLSGIYKGTSFCAGAVLVISASYLSSTLSRVRFSISNSVAFTGNVDIFGNLIKLPEDSIKIKIEAAFFSWIKIVVLPEENLPEAKETIRKLQKKYPGKEIELIGCKNIKDVFTNTDIIRAEKDNILKHSKRIINNHRVISYTTLSLILILLTVLLSYLIIPGSIKPLPQNLYPNYIIYAPDRDTNWIYRNPNRMDKDTIRFGEIGIGDMAMYRFELWNNGDINNPLVYELSGKDKDEFEVTRGDEVPVSGIRFLYMPDILQNLVLKFTPYKSEGEKEAILTFYPQKDAEKKKTLFLKGKSDYFKGGYSLRLRGDNEYIANPNRGNILGNEFTVSFWFKVNMLDKDGTYLISDEDQNWTQTKFTIEINKDTNLLLNILPSKNSPLKQINIYSKSKVNINEWNYAALAHKDNITSLVLNNEVITERTEHNHFQQAEDFFYFGTILHPKRKGDNLIRCSDCEFAFSEFRVYNKSLTKQEIFEKKYKKENPFDNRLLLYHDFEETDDKAVFDKTSNDIFGDFRQNPNKVLDIPPLDFNRKIIPANTKRDNCLRLKNKGQAILYKNLFKEPSSYTIQLDARINNPEETYFRKIINLGKVDNGFDLHWFGKDSIGISAFQSALNNSVASRKLKADNQWHRYILDYNKETNKGRLFIDGILITEIALNGFSIDISRNTYFLQFGGDWTYFNPRLICEDDTYIDNVAIYNRILNSNEVSLSTDIKSIPGLLAYWDFSDVKGYNAFDVLNNIPLFLWEDFEVMER